MYEDIFDKIKISDEEKKLTQELFDLSLERVIKKLYLSFNENGKKEMTEVFLSQNQKLQEEFIITHLPNLEDALKQEIEKLGEEIKIDVKK